MIPPVIGDETPSPGERLVFERLCTDPGTDGWLVLHSLDVPRHRRQIAGEVDFVIGVPGLGILCLEVKAHRSIQRDASGMWRLGQDPPQQRGPFRQAAEAMHSVRAHVVGRDPGLGTLLFWSAVCFTHTPFQLMAPAEWHQWQVIDTSHLSARPLPSLIIGVLSNARDHVRASPSGRWLDPAKAEPTAQQLDQVARILRPSFEFFESPKSRRRQRDDELRRYTSEQYIALDAMRPDTNPRVLFEGPAGTGKTLLAMEEARRSAARGERVLLLCFNRLLARSIESEMEPLANSVETGTLHRFMLRTAGTSVPAGAGSSFWQDELPEMALERVLDLGERFEAFDTLIVDEAQDVLHDGYLDLLDSVIRGGLAAGRWRLFGDFERQAIYGGSAKALDTVLAERCPGVPRYRLSRNCRNTPRIASYVTILGGGSASYTEILRPDNGHEPQTIYYESEAGQVESLTRLLEQLEQQGYAGREIIILSPRADGCAAERVEHEQWASRIKPADADGPGGVRYCTTHAFKGLEAPVVIVTDITSVGTASDESLFYVAVTRATDRLYVLADSSLQKPLVNLIVERATSGESS